MKFQNFRLNTIHVAEIVMRFVRTASREKSTWENAKKHIKKMNNYRLSKNHSMRGIWEYPESQKISWNKHTLR